MLVAADELEVLLARDMQLLPNMLVEECSLHAPNAPPFLDRRRCFRLLLELLQAQHILCVTRSLRLMQWQSVKLR